MDFVVRTMLILVALGAGGPVRAAPPIQSCLGNAHENRTSQPERQTYRLTSSSRLPQEERGIREPKGLMGRQVVLEPVSGAKAVRGRIVRVFTEDGVTSRLNILEEGTGHRHSIIVPDSHAGPHDLLHVEDPFGVNWKNFQSGKVITAGKQPDLLKAVQETKEPFVVIHWTKGNEPIDRLDERAWLEVIPTLAGNAKVRGRHLLVTDANGMVHQIDPTFVDIQIDMVSLLDEPLAAIWFRSNFKKPFHLVSRPRPRHRLRNPASLRPARSLDRVHPLLNKNLQTLMTKRDYAVYRRIYERKLSQPDVSLREIYQIPVPEWRRKLELMRDKSINRNTPEWKKLNRLVKKKTPTYGDVLEAFYDYTWIHTGVGPQHDLPKRGNYRLFVESLLDLDPPRLFIPSVGGSRLRRVNRDSVLPILRVGAPDPSPRGKQTIFYDGIRTDHVGEYVSHDLGHEAGKLRLQQSDQDLGRVFGVDGVLAETDLYLDFERFVDSLTQRDADLGLRTESIWFMRTHENSSLPIVRRTLPADVNLTDYYFARLQEPDDLGSLFPGAMQSRLSDVYLAIRRFNKWTGHGKSAPVSDELVQLFLQSSSRQRQIQEAVWFVDMESVMDYSPAVLVDVLEKKIKKGIPGPRSLPLPGLQGGDATVMPDEYLPALRAIRQKLREISER